MHRLVPLLLLTTALASTASLAAHAEASSKPCLKVSQGLLASLKSSLKAKARGRLGTPRAVKSDEKFGGLRDIRDGVYFTSARVRGFGIATWAVGTQAFKTGGGVIYGVGSVARRVSDAGVGIPTSTLAGWGLTPSADGYAESRACVK